LEAWFTVIAPGAVDRVDALVLAMAVATSPSQLAHSDDGQDSLPFEEKEVMNIEITG
jgi:hypothetical protein